jgi:methionyl-tRNA formyltransferase
MLKIVFISGVKFGYDLLAHILEKNWKISAIISYSSELKKNYSDYADFDLFTKKHNIINKKVEKINEDENIEFIKKLDPDLILVMGWSQLLNNDIIKIPRIGIIGSHPTELPKYRGRAPIPWTIIKGLKKSALTFFYIQEGVDNGDIVDQQMFKVEIFDDASSIYDKITDLGKEMLEKNLSLLNLGHVIRKKQNEHEFIENWPKRTPSDGKINWKFNAKEIDTLIRATTYPYPGAFTFFKNKKIIIWKSTFDELTNFESGKIISVVNGIPTIGTVKGTISFEKVSVENEINEPEKSIFSSADIGMKVG